MDTILDSQQVTAAISGALDASGQPVATPVFDTPPVWGSVPADGLTLTPASDGMSCVLSGTPGTYSISISAAAGGSPLSGTGQLVINPGAPVSFSISFGTASQKV